MDDEHSDPGPAGAAGPGPGTVPGRPAAGGAPFDPVLDQAARAEEFELFYLADMPNLVGFLIVRGMEPGLAADLAQETMLAAYQQWNVIDSPRAWVRTVARRKLARLTGRRAAEEPSEQVPERSGLLSPSEAEQIVQRHTILALLQALPEAQRDVMALTYDGYQPTEIAGLLGKPPSTVRSLLREARKRLSGGEEATT